jgi:hypothetical protein
VCPGRVSARAAKRGDMRWSSSYQHACGQAVCAQDVFQRVQRKEERLREARREAQHLRDNALGISVGSLKFIEDFNRVVKIH